MFLQLIQALWGLLANGTSVEARSLRVDLFYILIAIFLIPIIQLLTNDWGCITIIYAFLSIIMITWRMVNIRRIISLTVSGELAEFFRLMESQNGFPPNKVIELYIDLLKGVLYFSCAYFLTISWINFRLWWPGIVFIPFFSIVLIIFLGKKSGNFFRFMAGVVMFFWGAYALINLVPQIGYYTKLDTVISSVIPGEIAKKANNIEKIRQEQRSISLGSVYEKALEWQKLNPGRDLPVEFQENIEAAKKGLAVGELRQQKFSEKAKEDADDDEKNADQYAQNLSDGTIRIVHKGTNDYSKNFFLFPGTYDVNPKGKKFKISMKSTDWKFKEFSDELTVPDVANGKNQNMYFHSDENETFLIKKKEAKG